MDPSTRYYGGSGTDSMELTINYSIYSDDDWVYDDQHHRGADDCKSHEVGRGNERRV